MRSTSFAKGYGPWSYTWSAGPWGVKEGPTWGLKGPGLEETLGGFLPPFPGLLSEASVVWNPVFKRTPSV